MYLFKDVNVISEDGIVHSDVLTDGEKIIEVNESISNENAEIIQGNGKYLSAGFIDLHVHGGGGFSFMDKSSENIKKAVLAHTLHGTTGILPTMLSSPEEILIDCANRIAKINLAGILGVHFEGPYLSPEMSGAQSDDSIFPVNKNSALLQAEGLKMITMAPELANATILAEKFSKKGIVVAAGHTGASFDEMETAIEHGFSDFTHIYNASSSLHKQGAFRVAGAVESALTNEKCTVQVIGDLRHLPIGIVRLIYKCKGAHKAYFITDGLEFSAADLKDGERVVQANAVPAVFKDGVMMTDDLSKLAGSAATLDSIVRNAVKAVKIPLIDAVKMATLTPARVIGVDSHKGRIKAGYDADIILFDDDINVSCVMVNGKLI